jgi:GNAT superfamily N-acetyltransferase
MVTKQFSEIRIPGAPPIPGLTFRHYRGAADHALMAGLVNAANEGDGIPEASSEETMAHYYAEPKNLDPFKDVLITEVNGEPACYSRVFWLDEQADGEGKVRVYRSISFMHPVWRHKGLGRAILAYNEGRIRQIAASHPEEIKKFLQTVAPDANTGAAVLLRQFGYQVLRRFYVMSCDLSGEIPSASLPAGLELRPAQPEHYRQVWDAIEEAFIDHWGFSPRNDEDYLRWLEHPEFNPTLWKVAWDGDQVAGASVNLVSKSENELLGRNWAWTEPLGVRRPWRKRGLGRTLLLESQREMKARGIRAAALEVDTENTSNALHLYESCGYKTVRRWDLHRKELK